jgi:hypothetical protein
MIIVGGKKPKILVPAHIVWFELVKGKTTAFVKGDTDGDQIIVKDISVREPWTIVIKTTVDTHYVNFNNFDSALTYLIILYGYVDKVFDARTIESNIRRAYGQEKAKEQK